MTFYLVIFDRDPTGDYRGFHEEFVKHPSIRKWWHWVKSCYIVGADAPAADELSVHFRATAKKYRVPTRHLILKADLRNRQGLLPKKAWDWIAKAAEQQE